MALPTTLSASTAPTPYLAVNQSNVWIKESYHNTWTHAEFNIWIWDGALNGVSRGEEIKLIYQNLSQGQEARFDIKPYILEKLKLPTVPSDASDWDAYTPNRNVWVFYTYRMFNGTTVVQKRYESGDYGWDSYVLIAGWGTHLRPSLIAGRFQNLDFTEIIPLQGDKDEKQEIYDSLTFPTNRIPLFYTNGFSGVTNTLLYQKFEEYEAEVGCDQGHMIAYIDRFGTLTFMPLGGKVQATFDRSADKYMHSIPKYLSETTLRNSIGDYSEYNVNATVRWTVNTPYFSTKQYHFYQDILFSPFIWLITTKTDHATRVRITGSQTLQQKKYNNLLSFNFELEEMVKLM